MTFAAYKPASVFPSPGGAVTSSRPGPPASSGRRPATDRCSSFGSVMCGNDSPNDPGRSRSWLSPAAGDKTRGRQPGTS